MARALRPVGILSATWCAPETGPQSDLYSLDGLQRSLATSPGEQSGSSKWARSSPTKISSTAKGIPPVQACDMLERALYDTAFKFEGELDASKKREAQLQSAYDTIRAQEQSKARALGRVSFWFGCGTVLMVAIFWLVTAVWRWIRPGVYERKQLVVLVVTGAWCSGCAILQVTSEASMRHPVSAAIATILYSAPAGLFGGIAFWWYSPWKPRPGKVRQLW